MAKEKKIVKETKKPRKYSVEELRERKRFMTKMAMGTLALFGVIAAIIIPIAFFIY